MKTSTLNLASPILTAMHPGNPHGLRFAEGDGGEGASGGTGGQGGDGTGDDAGDGKGGEGEGTETPPAPPEWDGKVESLPGPVQKMIADLRKEAGDERVATKTLAAIQKALSPDAGTDDGKPDPAALATQVGTLTTERDEARTQARTAVLELATYKAAGIHRADPGALLDSRGFLAKIADLDPNASDFGTKLDDAIKDAVKNNPKLLAAPAAGASSADHAGGSGEGQTRTPKPLADAVAGAYSG